MFSCLFVRSFDDHVVPYFTFGDQLTSLVENEEFKFVPP